MDLPIVVVLPVLGEPAFVWRFDPDDLDDLDDLDELFPALTPFPLPIPLPMLSSFTLSCFRLPPVAIPDCFANLYYLNIQYITLLSVCQGLFLPKRGDL